jgi:hypothetical protein
VRERENEGESQTPGPLTHSPAPRICIYAHASLLRTPRVNAPASHASLTPRTHAHIAGVHQRAPPPTWTLPPPRTPTEAPTPNKITTLGAGGRILGSTITVMMHGEGGSRTARMHRTHRWGSGSAGWGGLTNRLTQRPQQGLTLGPTQQQWQQRQRQRPQRQRLQRRQRRQRPWHFHMLTLVVACQRRRQSARQQPPLYAEL